MDEDNPGKSRAYVFEWNQMRNCGQANHTSVKFKLAKCMVMIFGISPWIPIGRQGIKKSFAGFPPIIPGIYRRRHIVKLWMLKGGLYVGILTSSATSCMGWGNRWGHARRKWQAPNNEMRQKLSRAVESLVAFCWIKNLCIRGVMELPSLSLKWIL